MKTNIIVASCLVLVAVAACWLLRSATARPAAAVPGQAFRLGDDARFMGQATEAVVVPAMVYDANHGEPRPALVRIEPGTWLVPPSAMSSPIQKGTNE